jgi:hypothetical protein
MEKDIYAGGRLHHAFKLALSKLSVGFEQALRRLCIEGCLFRK